MIVSNARFPLTLLALSGLLWPAAGIAEEWPAPIAALEKQGLNVHQRFDAPSGLTGYAASVRGQAVAVYLTEDGEHAIVGTLLDAEGNDLSAAQLDELVRKPQDAATWNNLGDSAWIADGAADAERIVYVFTDPNCPYCQQFWSEARPWVEAGKVQLRHIMVGILKQDSPRKAISLLAADDPAAALHAHQQGSQAIALLESLPREFEDALAKNHRLMQRLGLRATPSILYRRDGLLKIAQGVPAEQQLEAIMGSPRP
ncbi:thiol:disulfide interchange protein DsbG [Modicisalibacter muralis]|uniref:Thiol:disulfide interchange protein n=1 Tax=Modicisalibacter muralis TaxID=119000 RepID=A0A1G9IXV8_9GAMM|nr:thiol:disulfide interchange protein DsbG [Halomonas muralis]SDL30077.1 thiol:disulfide interchange protein DsbG [Halomonas muralis]